MPASGWYPDPDGTPDRYRFWDGTAWSSATTTDPRQPPPVPGQPTAPRRPAVALLIGVLALIVIVVVAAVMIIRGNTSNRITDQRFPSSSSSGWDDSSPTPTPTPIQSVTPTPSASPTPNGLVPCPTGDPNTRASHPNDSRVYGGNLSFPRVATFKREAPEPRMTFAHDVTQQTLEVSTDPGWIAQLAVGRLLTSDGFTSAEQAAAEFAECSITGLMYQQYSPTRQDRQSKAITVSGQPGWLIDTDIRVVDPGLPFAGDHAVFVVIKDGADWGMFFGAAPIGNAELEKVLQSTIGALRAG
jgi:Protein of unknown function (DUF2510)